MVNEENILNAIFSAIDTVNDDLSKKRKISKSIDENLYGKNGCLDSLGLVNLIVALEEEIEDEFDIALVLTDEKALSQKNSPFQSIRSLSNFILNQLNEKEQSTA